MNGVHEQSKYGKVILPVAPFVLWLESTKEAVLTEQASKKQIGVNHEPFMLRKTGQSLYSISSLNMKELMEDQDHIPSMAEIEMM